MGDRGQRAKIFATRDDWTPVLDAFEVMLKIKYVESGVFPSSEPEVFSTSRKIPNFAEPAWGNSVAERQYLLMLEQAPIYSESFSLNTGELRYARDHANNPESVILSPGGVFESHRAVIYGEVSKLSKLETTELLFRSLTKLVKKTFPSIDGYRVGPAAAALNRKGYRLTQDIRASLEYDLALPRASAPSSG